LQDVSFEVTLAGPTIPNLYSGNGTQNKTVHFYPITNLQQVKKIKQFVQLFSPHLPTPANMAHNFCMKNTEHFQILPKFFISFSSSFLFLHQGYSVKGLADLNKMHQQLIPGLFFSTLGPKIHWGVWFHSPQV